MDRARWAVCRNHRGDDCYGFRPICRIFRLGYWDARDRRGVRRHVYAEADDQRELTHAREVHDDRTCAAGMGVLRVPRGSPAAGQEAPLREPGGFLGTEHGQTRSAHKRCVRGQLHGVATCSQVAWRPLLRRSSCPRCRNRAGGTRGPEEASAPSDAAHDRPNTLIYSGTRNRASEPVRTRRATEYSESRLSEGLPARECELERRWPTGLAL